MGNSAPARSGDQMTADAFVRERDRLYRATRRPELVEVPDMAVILVDGSGNPNTSQEFADAIQALFSVSYTLKFSLKKEAGLAYRAGPLEALWWSADSAGLPVTSMDTWRWTALIAQPDGVSQARFEGARDSAALKRELPALRKVRLGRLHEGLAAQVLHVGPYSSEGPTIAALHAFIADSGYSFDGRSQKHHEIYLGDPRRSAPERLRTIIRQPVVPAGPFSAESAAAV